MTNSKANENKVNNELDAVDEELKKEEIKLEDNKEVNQA